MAETVTEVAPLTCCECAVEKAVGGEDERGCDDSLQQAMVEGWRYGGHARITTCKELLIARVTTKLLVGKTPTWWVCPRCLANHHRPN
jgi:hypothetical protein